VGAHEVEDAAASNAQRTHPNPAGADVKPDTAAVVQPSANSEARTIATHDVIELSSDSEDEEGKDVIMHLDSDDDT
jgi:hypothetical protein